MTDRIQYGTTLFSLTPDWRAGESAASILQRVADAGCGPALEVIGHQAWRGFPAVSADDERAFRDAVDRLGLIPVALGVYTDLFRRSGRPMSADEAFEDIRPQLEVGRAARLPARARHAGHGVPACCAASPTRPSGSASSSPSRCRARRSPTLRPSSRCCRSRRRPAAPTSASRIDFSLTTPGAARSRSERRCAGSGCRPPRSRPSTGSGPQDEPLGRRIGAALALGRRASRRRPRSTILVAGVLRPHAAAGSRPTGRDAAAGWSGTRTPSSGTRTSSRSGNRTAPGSPRWTAAGYAGAVVSEWGGHELLDRADADALTVTRDHLDLLAELRRRSRDGGDGMTDEPRAWCGPDALSARDGRLARGGPPAVVPLAAGLLPGGASRSPSTAPRRRSAPSAVRGFAGRVAEAAGSDADWDLRDAARRRRSTWPAAPGDARTPSR